MRYRIKDTGIVYDEINDAVWGCIDVDYHRDDDYFEEWVNDAYGNIVICGRYYNAYDILDSMDSCVLTDLLSDFCDSMDESDADDAIWELKRAEVGDTVDVQGNTIEVLPDETGDYDGDEEVDMLAIDACRKKIEEQNLKLQQLHDAEKDEEDNYMKMFQVI